MLLFNYTMSRFDQKLDSTTNSDKFVGKHKLTLLCANQEPTTFLRGLGQGTIHEEIKVYFKVIFILKWYMKHCYINSKQYVRFVKSACIKKITFLNIANDQTHHFTVRVEMETMKYHRNQFYRTRVSTARNL